MADSLEQEIRTLRSLFWSDLDPGGRGFAPLADAYRRAGDLEQAVELLQDGLARLPDFATGHFVAGLVQGAMSDAESAVRSFERVLQLDPGNLLAQQHRDRIAQEGTDAYATEEPGLHFAGPGAEPPSGDAVPDFDLGASAGGAVDELSVDDFEPWGATEDEAAIDLDAPIDLPEMSRDGAGDADGDVELSMSESGTGGDVFGDFDLSDLDTGWNEEGVESDAADTASDFDLPELSASAGGSADEGKTSGEIDLDIGFPSRDEESEAPAPSEADSEWKEAEAGGDEDFALEIDLDAGPTLPPEATAAVGQTESELDSEPAVPDDRSGGGADGVSSGNEDFGIELEPAEFEGAKAAADPLDPAGGSEPVPAVSGEETGDEDVLEWEPAAAAKEWGEPATLEDLTFEDAGETEPGETGDEVETSGEVGVEEAAEVGVEEAAEVGVEAAGEAGDRDDDLYTRTMGELYARQGLHARAVEVYEHLLECDPENPDFRDRLQELRDLADGRAERPPREGGAGRAERGPVLSEHPFAFSSDAVESEAVEDGSGSGAIVPRGRGEAEDEGDDAEMHAPQWAAAGDGEAEMSSPFLWATEADEEGPEEGAADDDGPAISSYLEDLLAWVPGAVPIDSLAPEEGHAGSGRLGGSGEGKQETFESPAERPDDGESGEEFDAWLDRMKP